MHGHVRSWHDAEFHDADDGELCGRRPRSAVPLSSFGARGALSHFLFMGLLLTSFTASGAVCPLCQDWFPGCKGGNDCPFTSGPATNAARLAQESLPATPSLFQLLPTEMLTVFTRSVVESLVSLRLTPVSGAVVDFTTDAFKTSTSIARACIMGHCSVDDAALELT